MRNRTWIVMLLVAGCGGGSKKTAEPTPEPAPAPVDRDAAAGRCLAMMQKQRDCTDVFIPALVGWRVELDVPAGVAALDVSDGRDMLVAKAKEEWAASNADDQLETLCTSIITSIPDEQLGPMMEIGERCIATTTCQEYVACIEPMQRQRLEAQRAAQAGQPAGD